MRNQVSVLAAIAALTTACAAPDAARAEKRTFVIAAVEPKGGTNAAQESFPAEKLPRGGGYVIKEPDASGRWEVSVYVWQPMQIVVNEGDEVTLEFVGINGASHPTTISGYGKSFMLKRGHIARVTFTANKAGAFAIRCATHPTMAGELVVLPKR
jgi:plastocyanin